MLRHPFALGDPGRTVDSAELRNFGLAAAGNSPPLGGAKTSAAGPFRVRNLDEDAEPGYRAGTPLRALR